MIYYERFFRFFFFSVSSTDIGSRYKGSTRRITSSILKTKNISPNPARTRRFKTITKVSRPRRYLLLYRVCCLYIHNDERKSIAFSPRYVKSFKSRGRHVSRTIIRSFVSSCLNSIVKFTLSRINQVRLGSFWGYL